VSSKTENGSQLATGEDNSPSQPTVAIHTHGCKLNQADSQSLARQFRDAGYRLVEPSSSADIIVLNSCTVTATADAKARQFLRAAKRRNPKAVVVATGCYAQRAPGELEKLDAVSLVLGNTAKSELVEASHRALRGTAAAPVASTLVPAVRATGLRTRAMVKIQEGCNQVCAYCIVPKVRGRERSIPSERIAAEINRHSAEGCREVALTGTQLGSYGFDIPGLDLAGLLERILSETTVERVRVSSLQAHEITEQLLSLWADTRLMRHFHIPLQSGNDRILRSMRRRYDTAQFCTAVDAVRERYPDAGITTDFIVGFPGETGDDFRHSREFAAAMHFSDIHVFPYSPRPGTSAFHFGDQVAELSKRERMGEMLALSAACRLQFRESQLGTVRPVLWEQSSKSQSWTGLTDNYVRVRTASESDLANRIVNAKLTAIDGDWVLANIV
jgi:threonylcarbamoyladenosine tRNA methylthiotransferase MtaB